MNHCGGEENRQQSRDMYSTILHQNSNIVCEIVGNIKSVNNVAYKSYIFNRFWLINHLQYLIQIKSNIQYLIQYSSKIIQVDSI